MACADRFLSTLLERKRLVDYFGVSDLDVTRDVFIVASRSPVEFDGSIQKSISNGGSFGIYPKDCAQKPMICCPSKNTIDELLLGPVKM